MLKHGWSYLDLNFIEGKKIIIYQNLREQIIVNDK